jgi:SAM-dependent methyltransferase
MPTEFDDYAANYGELVRDPIRDRFADGSAFFFERKWILLAAFLKRRGIRCENTAWLDVGCGQGELLRLGKSSFHRIAGCDVSDQMLSAARDLDVTIQQDPERLPYANGEFDLVTAVCVYHHVTVDEMRHKLTAEVRRVLKPGGIFCIIEHNPLNPATRLIVSRIPVDRDARLLNPSLSRKLLTGGGLRILESEFFLYLPERLYHKLNVVESWMKRIPLGGQYAIFAEKPV